MEHLCYRCALLQLVAETGCLSLSVKHRALVTHPNVRALELSHWGRPTPTTKPVS